MSALTLELPSSRTMDFRNGVGKTGHDDMSPEYQRSGSDGLRDRVDRLAEGVVENKGRQQGHEELCAQRYKEILEKISEVQKDQVAISNQLQADIAKGYSRGLLFFLGILAIALGQAVWPVFMNVITKFPL